MALPNDLIGNMYGPVGKGNYILNDLLVKFPILIFVLYGDPAYPIRVHLQAPFRHMVLTPQMVNFNKAMSSVRVSMEWLFGDIGEYLKFVDFKKNLKIGLSNIGKMYIVCALLRNVLTCLYSNTAADFFELDPPTLEEYFAWSTNKNIILCVIKIQRKCARTFLNPRNPLLLTITVISKYPAP